MNALPNFIEDIILTGKMILSEYSNELNEQGEHKEKVSLVFLARSLRQLQAINKLIDLQQVSDGWILYRSLLERYLLFVHLCETLEFEQFDDWCFKQRYEHLNTLKSIKEFKGKPEMQNRRFSDEEKARYQRVQINPLVNEWRRPDMEGIARKLKMKFLYNAGYDWASSFVHPNTTDGMDDYLILMDRPPSHDSNDIHVLLGNACLISVMHIQRFMIEPEYNWRSILNDLIDTLAKTAGGENCDYVEMLNKVRWFHEAGGGLFCRNEG